MTERTISKVLITQEDLALGQGSTSQTRQGVSVPVNQIDLPWCATTLVELKAFDPTKYKHVILDDSTAQLFYRYDAASTAIADDYNYVTPNSGTGRWTLVANLTGLKNEKEPLLKFESMATFVATAIPAATNVIKTIGYYGGWAATTKGPVGGIYWHKTGYTNSSPSVGTAVTPSTIGTSTQAGLAWDASGAEWRIGYGNGTRVDVQCFGVVGDGTTDDDDKLQDAKTFCDTTRSNLWVPGGLTVNYSTTLDFTASQSSFTEGAVQPLVFDCEGELYYQSTDYAIKAPANLVGGLLRINSVRGPGRSGGNTVAGGGNENIGIHIGPNSGAVIHVHKVTDFRHGILLDGCYNNTVYYSAVLACDIGIHFRGNPTLGYGCIANHVYGNLSGGPYTSVVTQPERVPRCNRIGVLIDEAARSNDFVGNTEYSIGAAGGIGLDCRGDRNRITCYSEGHSDGMNCYNISGDQNELKLGGGSALSSASPALVITGVNNKVWLPQNKGTSTTDSTFAPHNGQTEYDVHESTEFFTLNEEWNQQDIFTSNWNMLSGIPFSVTGGFTLTSSVADRPPEFTDARTCVTLTCATNNTEWYTSNGSGTFDTVQNKVLVSVWLKRITNNPKVSIFIRNQATGETLESYNTALTSDGWKKVQFLADVGTATSFNMRIAARNLDSGTGYAFRVFNPYVSQSLDAPEPQIVNSNYVLPAKKVTGYNHYIDVQRFDAQNSLDANSVASLTSNVLAAGNKPVVIITDNPGANVVNSITGMEDDSELTIINAHSAAITLTTTLGEWPTNISLTNGRSIKIHKRGGLYYAGL